MKSALSHEWVPLVNLLVILAAVSYFVIRSRSWSLPMHATRLDTLEHDNVVLRGNLTRLERDVSTWRREDLETNHAILQELEAIRQNGAKGAKEHPMIDELVKIEERIVDLEQLISALPCAEHLAAFADKAPKPESK